MRLLCCRNWMWVAAATLGLGTASPASAGLIPWGYNAVYGTSPMYGGYAYSNPGFASPYSVGFRPAYTTSSYYSPAWSAYSAGYGPAFSYSSYGSAFGTFGSNNGCCACAPCGCSPCGTGGCADGNCSGCTNGNCASGNCGAGYAPPIDNGPTPEPTPSNPPKPNPPAENHRNPPVDDFRPVPNRANDSTVPSVNPMPGHNSPLTPINPGNTIPTNPNSSIPNTSIPNNSVPNTSIPNTSIPNNSIPNPIGNPSAPFFNDANENFKTPTFERNPAPVEPNGASPVLNKVPSETRLQPTPLDLDAVRVTSVHINRQRIITQAGFQTRAVARMDVTPRWNAEIELARK